MPRLVRVPVSTRRVQFFPQGSGGGLILEEVDTRSNFLLAARLVRRINFGSAFATAESSHCANLGGTLHDHFSAATFERTDHEVFHLWRECHRRIEQDGRGGYGCPRVLLRA